MAEKVRLEQVNSLSIFVSVMSVTGLGTVLLVLFEYWDVGFHQWLAVACSFIIGCYAALIIMSLRWSLGRRIAHGSSERMLGRYVRVCAALGIAWGGLLVVLMRFSNVGERSLLYGVIIGLMSAGVVVTPPSAAFAFWIPITSGGIIAISLVSTARDFGGSVLLTGYTSLTLFCLLYLNRALIRRVVAEVSQSDGRETIDMLLRDFEDSACDWLWETDRYGRLTHVSKRFAEMARVDMRQLSGADFPALIEKHRWRPAAESPRLPTSTSDMAVFMSCQMPFRDIEVSLEINGQPVWWALTGKPRYSHQQLFDGYRGVGSDVTQRKIATQRAQFLAHYDELTGLANRRLFREMLSFHLQQSDAPTVALLCLDLDGFKTINDNYGHPIGDLLLIAVARRLEGQVRGSEFCARLGGDEFAVVVPGAGAALVEVMARRLVAELSKPYMAEGIQLEVGVSIGIAIAAIGDRSSETILRHADAALYQAKSDGRGTLRLYDRALDERHTRRHVLQNELQRAIDNDDLRLEFQPIFNLGTGQLSAVEALVRWARQSGEVLSPGEFVPLAEGCGLIDNLGEWVLTRACHEASRLPPSIKLAVNASPLQLRGRRLINHLHLVLAVTELDPRRLEIELTETAFLDMSQTTLEALHEIRRLGIGVNLDDFGVGQTSLGQLRRFPFSTMKIDQSFIQDMPGNPSSLAIVRGLTSIASDLGIRTTAEGIETEEQLDLVRSLGCDYAQGFLLARPMSIARVLELTKSAITAAGTR